MSENRNALARLFVAALVALIAPGGCGRGSVHVPSASDGPPDRADGASSAVDAPPDHADAASPAVDAPPDRADGDLDARPEAALCPQSSENDPLATAYAPDLCSGCPGLSCASGATCYSQIFFNSGPTYDACACVDGHMGCCTRVTRADGMSSCDYGGFAPPACPSAPPRDGDPCGVAPNVCVWDDACCPNTSGRRGFCVGGKWEVLCGTPSQGDPCLPGSRCEGVALDGSNAPCRCDQTDGGLGTFTCGAGI
jgi:hypothetical protein